MPIFQIALVSNIPAQSYKQALETAKALASEITLNGPRVTTHAETDYDYDNEGQRVLYLHPENQPI